MEGVTANRTDLPRTSTNLRDLLKVRDDDATARNGHNNEPLTLATALACEKPPSSATAASSSAAAAAVAAAHEGAPPGGRTLLDVIRRDETPAEAAAAAPEERRGEHRYPAHHGIRWKSLKSLLRLRRAVTLPNSSSAASSGVQLAAPPVGANPDVGLNWSFTFREHLEVEQSPLPREPSAQEAPIRVSLMALLEEADRAASGGGGGPSFATALMGVVGDDEADAGDERGGGDAAAERAKEGMYVCCVCMVRHKGAAFIPCGHTFCRLCSRELWVSRGNCPLCNGFILEILDIF